MQGGPSDNVAESPPCRGTYSAQVPIPNADNAWDGLAYRCSSTSGTDWFAPTTHTNCEFKEESTLVKASVTKKKYRVNKVRPSARLMRCK